MSHRLNLFHISVEVTVCVGEGSFVEWFGLSQCATCQQENPKTSEVCVEAHGAYIMALSF